MRKFKNILNNQHWKKYRIKFAEVSFIRLSIEACTKLRHPEGKSQFGTCQVAEQIFQVYIQGANTSLDKDYIFLILLNECSFSARII